MDNEDDLLSHFLALYAKAAVCNVAELRREAETNVGTRLNCPTVPRARKSVHQVYREMGKTFFRRSFRMTYSAFCRLLRLIEPGLQEAWCRSASVASRQASGRSGGEEPTAASEPEEIDIYLFLLDIY